MLRVGIGKSKNMAKNGRKFTRKERPVMNPLGSVNSKRGVQHFDACPKIHKYAQKSSKTVLQGAIPQCLIYGTSNP